MKHVIRNAVGRDPFFSYKSVYQFKKTLRPSLEPILANQSIFLPVKSIVAHSLCRLKPFLEAKINQIMADRNANEIHLILYGIYFFCLFDVSLCLLLIF